MHSEPFFAAAVLTVFFYYDRVAVGGDRKNVWLVRYSPRCEQVLRLRIERDIIKVNPYYGVAV